MSTKMTPQLRFPEFADEWKVRKLGDITQINPRVGSLPDDFVYIDLDSVKRGTLLKQNRISKIGSPSRAQRLLSRDDIIYQTVRPYQKNNFYFDKAGDYVASTGYAQIRAREGYYPRFVYTLLHTSAFVNKVLVRSTGTNYPAINSNDLAKVKVHTPSKPEQEKIADFLTAVDERIAVGEKKLQLLETYKRGVMQKIFTRTVRFKDENGNPYPDLEEKKLGSFIRDFKQSSTIQDEYPVMTSSRKGIILQKDYYGDDNRITERSNVGYNVLPPKYLTYRSRSDDGRFRFNLNTTSTTGIVSYFYPVFDIKSGNVKFFEEYLNYNWRILYKYSVGTSQKVLSHTELKNIRFDIPVIEEQQKIAAFFTALDDKITAEKSKLTAARKFKKALLQRMFV